MFSLVSTRLCMHDFVKEVVLDRIRFTFHFRLITTPKGSKYFVCGKNQLGNHFSFDMQGEGRTWRIINAPQVNASILRNEEILSDLIRVQCGHKIFR